MILYDGQSQVGRLDVPRDWMKEHKSPTTMATATDMPTMVAKLEASMFRVLNQTNRCEKVNRIRTSRTVLLATLRARWLRREKGSYQTNRKTKAVHRKDREGSGTLIGATRHLHLRDLSIYNHLLCPLYACISDTLDHFVTPHPGSIHRP